jgi:hypothetical protein
MAKAIPWTLVDWHFDDQGAEELSRVEGTLLEMAALAEHGRIVREVRIVAE